MYSTLPLSPEFVIIIFLVTALVITIWVVFLVNKERRSARKDCASAVAELEKVRKEATTLLSRAWSSDFPTHLSEFESGKFYTLLACGDLVLDGETVHYGVVRDEDGGTYPFITYQAVQLIDIQDTFTLIEGKLAKLIGDSSAHNQPLQERPDIQFSKQNTVTDASSSAASKETNTKDDATVLFSVASKEAGDDKTRVLNIPPIGAQYEKTVLHLDSRDPAKLQRDFNTNLIYLKILKGIDKNKKFHLPFGKATIGRDHACTVALKDNSCSHVHSIIEYVDTGFMLRDNNSTNGTFCNESRVAEKMLEFGDKITVGDSTLLFTCEGYELKDSKPQEAIIAFERCLERQPEFLAVLKNLAFLLKRDFSRTKEAQPLLDKIKELEKRG